MVLPTAWRCAQAPEAANKTNPHTARVFIEGDSTSRVSPEEMTSTGRRPCSSFESSANWSCVRMAERQRGGAGRQIEILTEGEVTIVRLEGRFVTGSDAEYLRTKEAMTQSASQKVVVDCHAVPYLDSTALNFVVGLYTMITNNGGRLAVCGVNPRMSEVLRITHLDEIIPVYTDRAAAMAAVEVPSPPRRRAKEI